MALFWAALERQSHNSGTSPFRKPRCYWSSSRTFALLLMISGLALSVSERAFAQDRQVITGVVRSEPGPPLASALVTLDGDTRNARRMRTDDQGRFHFSNVPFGEHHILIVRVGYRPFETEINLTSDGARLEVILERLPTSLGTVRVEARQQGVFGSIVDRVGFSPLAEARVEILRGRATTKTDSLGQFDLRNGVAPGKYVLFSERDGFQAKMMAVTIPKDSAVEVLVLLDSMSASGGKRRAMPLAEFRQRVNWIGTRAALVTADELVGHERLSLADALRYAPSFLRKGLLIHDAVTCLYIDGLPQPFLSANDISAEDVEAVEIYGLKSDYTGTAASRWPPGVPCGNPAINPPPRLAPGGTSAFATGLRPAGVRSARARTDNYVRAVIVWLKR